MIAGFNVSLKWSYTLKNGEALNLIEFNKLENGQKNEIGYINLGGHASCNLCNGKMTIAKGNKSALLFIHVANRSDETEYCCKIEANNENENCIHLLVIGEFNVLARWTS